MDKLEKLNNLKVEAMSLIKSALYYMKALQPLNNPTFMNPDEMRIYNGYKVIITNLEKQYSDLYRTLTIEERSKHEHMNILGEFNHSITVVPCIEMAYNSDDEYELNDKFRKAYDFGVKALEEKIEAEKRKDNITILNANRVLAACHMVFKAHFWGESYQEDLDEYEKRLRSGRTVSDDLSEYDELYNEAIDLSIEYAKDLVNGGTHSTEIWKKYEPLFKREDQLLRFVPREKRPNTEHNLHWLRLQVQSNPTLFLNRYGVNYRTR